VHREYRVFESVFGPSESIKKYAAGREIRTVEYVDWMSNVPNDAIADLPAADVEARYHAHQTPEPRPGLAGVARCANNQTAGMLCAW